jgi:SAM-dependent methyltransferase
MTDDPWLEPWLPLIASKAHGVSILELGCGDGRDTEVLARAGHRVVGVDLSVSAVAEAASRLPSCEFHCQDIRAPFPEAGANVNVVLASLCLHYFPWAETVSIVRRIHHSLQPGGVLLCRLNSTEDHNFGASGHPEIERNFYMVNGEPKRFFDRPAVEQLFAEAEGWRLLSLRHQVVGRYALPKALWEAVLEVSHRQ